MCRRTSRAHRYCAPFKKYFLVQAFMKKIIKFIKWYIKEAFKPDYNHYKAGNLWSMLLIPIFIIIWILILIDKYF